MEFDLLKKMEEIRDLIKSEKIEFIDLKAMDIFGRIRHLTLPVSMFTEDLIEKGVGIDGSNYGFSKIDKSDFIAIPDLDTFFIENDSYNKRASFLVNFKKDPDSSDFIFQDLRYLSKRCEKMIKDLKVGDEILFSPEYEFYIFDRVDFEVGTHTSFYSIYSKETGNETSYHIDIPKDRYFHIRCEIVSMLESSGIKTKYHHHEVGQWGQQEIEIGFNGLLKSADISLLFKYFSRKVAERNGVVVTFMPKPLKDMAGSGWHVHQFIQKDGKSIFFDENSLLSEMGLHYVGGLIRHAKALCAFTNPSVNSYKRLTPGYEAPVSIDFGEGDRSSLIRIPQYAKNVRECRIEYRVPDFSCNPYLALSAMTMAGIDGIIEKIDPYEEIKRLKSKGEDRLPGSLEKAVEYLSGDKDFLKRGGIFKEDLINNWIKVKENEMSKLNSYVSPAEYLFYFDM